MDYSDVQQFIDNNNVRIRIQFNENYSNSYRVVIRHIGQNYDPTMYLQFIKDTFDANGNLNVSNIPGFFVDTRDLSTDDYVFETDGFSTLDTYVSVGDNINFEVSLVDPDDIDSFGVVPIFDGPFRS